MTEKNISGEPEKEFKSVEQAAGTPAHTGYAGPAVTMQQYIESIKKANATRRAEGESPRAYVLTFGCQQNEADSERYAGMARAMGYELTDDPSSASLIVVNTCAVREHAEKKTLSIIGQYKHLKHKNPALIIAVGGCMVTQQYRADELKNSYPYVDIVFGTSSMDRLPELIWRRMEGRGRQFCQAEEYRVSEDVPVSRESNYRAWVSVMYGCNNFCSYCIVPYVRGRERSRRPKNIVDEVRQLAADGYRDITLLGQNVNSYGKDLCDNYDFADLITELSSIPGDFRLRFMTSHPKDATRKLVDAMAASEKVARHFHLPLQSGSDRVLRVMNRHYDGARYLETVDYIRERMPDIALTTDIIVGFPGESEEEFEDTLNMLRRVRFDMIFSFIYSPRRGTPAASMPDQVPDDIKSDRFRRLLEVQNAISAEINRKLEGQTLRVLCDGISKSDNNFYSGRTDGNKIVFFPGTSEDTGRFVDVHIDRSEAFALYGNKI
ncbi:MAG: tRNA (N6-isopentenyl adenosine(37)-C2)-methylthiotransferase MiaB [Eubacteriales bacterium]|nr:tRNA (N6-isopentenyl adenosine(37)-C2)-methylthiotransferase MiaB [Eubacteriales bacterium]